MRQGIPLTVPIATKTDLYGVSNGDVMTEEKGIEGTMDGFVILLHLY